MLYPESIPNDWNQRLELMGVPIAISPLHDRDKSNVEGQTYKKAHYHVVYVAKILLRRIALGKEFKGLWGLEAFLKCKLLFRA